MTRTLPPLPEPARQVLYNESKGYTWNAFTADQMREYAQQALAAASGEPPNMRDAFERWIARTDEDFPHYAVWKAACAWMAASGEPATVSDLLRRSRNLLSHPPLWWQENEASRMRLIGQLDAALHAVVSEEPNMRHPKIQALISSNARRNIELQLVEQLLDDPDCELTSMDMEYWYGLHDKLRDRLLTAAQK